MLCECLTSPEYCVLRIMMGHHRFVYNCDFDLDEGKKELLRNMPRRNIDSDNVSNPLSEEHLWENNQDPVSFMEVLLDLRGDNFVFLTEFRAFFDNLFVPAVDNDVRKYVYREALDGGKQTYGRRGRLWAQHVFNALNVEPQAPLGTECRMLIHDYCTFWNDNDDPSVVDFFVGLGADLLTADGDNNTLVHRAISVGRRRVLKRAVELFRKSEPSINQKNNDNMTAYFYLITHETAKNDEETRNTLNQMLSVGADPLSTRGEHETCLHYAISKGQQVNGVSRLH